MKAILPICLVLGMSVVEGGAQVRSVSGILSQPSHTHLILPLGGGDFTSTSTAGLSVASGSVSAFVANFSGLGETTVQITMRMPPGKMIRVVRPDNYQTASFAYRIQTTEYFGTGAASVPATIQFLRGSGVPALASPTAIVSGPGGEGFLVMRSQVLSFGDAFTAKSIVITLTVPASYSIDANTAISAFELTGVAETAVVPFTVADAGAWIHLVDDPVYLSLKRKLEKLKRRLKVLKKKGKTKPVRNVKRKIRKVKREIRVL